MGDGFHDHIDALCTLVLHTELMLTAPLQPGNNGEAPTIATLIESWMPYLVDGYPARAVEGLQRRYILATGVPYTRKEL